MKDIWFSILSWFYDQYEALKNWLSNEDNQYGCLMLLLFLLIGASPPSDR